MQLLPQQMLGSTSPEGSSSQTHRNGLTRVQEEAIPEPQTLCPKPYYTLNPTKPEPLNPQTLNP